MSVNAFTREQIEAAGVRNWRLHRARAEHDAGRNAERRQLVRGGARHPQARNSEPSVAVMIDGVLGPVRGFARAVRSSDRVEGPQGAVYGRNAIGGAIIIRTADPGDESRVA
jgi:iron complex outermembrane receptor protein